MFSSNHFSVTDTQTVREAPNFKGNKSRFDNFSSIHSEYVFDAFKKATQALWEVYVHAVPQRRTLGFLLVLRPLLKGQKKIPV